MARPLMGRWALALVGAAVLTGCADGEGLQMFKKDAAGGTETGRAATDTSAVRRVDRDVEAPEVFQVTESGLWDGRPSLGGVWVAHPDVTDPERVIIRNQANDKFVVGALFRRERENPGPTLQVSSDAAAALGMLAGAPVSLNVTALRREEVPLSQEVVAEEPVEGAAEEAAEVIETAAVEKAEVSEPLLAAEEIQVASLDPVATAEAALVAAEAAKTRAATAPEELVAALEPAQPEAGAPPAEPKSRRGNYIQIGMFSVKDNADRTSDQLRGAGIIPTIETKTSGGKDFYSVMVGPLSSRSERRTMLKKVKDLGYSDAYLISKK